VRRDRVVPDVAEGAPQPAGLPGSGGGVHVSMMSLQTIQHKRRLLTKDEAML
jgi:hypothetical protein